MTRGPRRRQVLAAGGGVLATGLAGCAGMLEGSGPEVAVDERSAIGTRSPIRLTGAAAVETVTVSATDAFGRKFEAAFDVSDLDDVEADAVPAAGFRDGDPSESFERFPERTDGAVTRGLGGEGVPRMPLHYLRPVADDVETFVGVDSGGDDAGAHEVTVEARDSDGPVASATGRRVHATPDLEERQISDEELVG